MGNIEEKTPYKVLFIYKDANRIRPMHIAKLLQVISAISKINRSFLKRNIINNVKIYR